MRYEPRLINRMGPRFNNWSVLGLPEVLTDGLSGREGRLQSANENSGEKKFYLFPTELKFQFLNTLVTK